MTSAQEWAMAQALDRDWMTVAQTAAYLQVTTRTVHRWLDAGLLTYSQLVTKGSIRVSASSIERFLENRTNMR